ncbi:MAG: acriflavin resistance protein [Isosphaeraceae bacterium]|jgi:RND family efflux transporter MFP subunit|nr:MAG: acriflavin resistance protein [Isosphaeraceae bacterium]
MRRGLGVVAALCVAGGVTGCGHHADPSHDVSGPKAPEAVAVTVTPLERRPVEQTVNVEGNLKAWDEVTVSAKKGGRVLKIHHDMGDLVAPGAVLVELDPIDAQLARTQAEARYLAELSKLGITREQAERVLATYGFSEEIYRGEEASKVIEQLPATQQAKATLEKAANELARQEGLYARGVGTLQDLQNAQKDYEAASAALGNVRLSAQSTVANALTSRAALAIAEQDLREMTISAPTPATLPEGRTRAEELRYAVTRRSVHEGQLIKDGEAVMDLVIDDPIRVWVSVPERFRPEIAVGQTIKLEAQARPGEVFVGRVSRINPAVDPLSRSFQVEAIVPNAEGKLRPGGFAKGEIVLRTDAQSVVVPLEAIYRFAGVTKIYLVEDGKARGYPVRVGRVTKGLAAVVGDGVELPETGSVVTTGQSVLAKLAEATPVVIREPEPDPTPPSIRATDPPSSGE